MLSEEMKKRSFWKSVFKLGIPSSFLFGIIYLIMNYPSRGFSESFSEAFQESFVGDNWIFFLSLILVLGFICGLVLTTYNLEEERKEKEKQFN